MFDVLVSSKVRRQVRPSRALGVAILHGMLIAGVIHATTAPLIPPTRPFVDTTLFVLQESEAVHATASPSSGGFPIAAPAPTIEVPIELPTGIPPVTLGPALDPAILRRALSGGPSGSPAGDSTGEVQILASAEVDEPATPVHQPDPRYPPVLKQAGISGRVVVEFIIDTTGHLERASVRVVESTNRGFEAAALETLQKSLFRPARVKGRPVRQRTMQTIVFRIEP
ncbi:MAG: TonB family protein [Gemmatimonadales bacterium]|nr:TonB family protein [Gemmatimonadales bacterium]